MWVGIVILVLGKKDSRYNFSRCIMYVYVW